MGDWDFRVRSTFRSSNCTHFIPQIDLELQMAEQFPNKRKNIRSRHGPFKAMSPNQGSWGSSGVLFIKPQMAEQFSNK